MTAYSSRDGRLNSPGKRGRVDEATEGIATEGGGWLTPRKLKALPRVGVVRTVWPMMWVTCLLMVFESQVRSMGRNEPYAGTMLIPGFWLSDVGLILPVLVVLASGRLRSRLFKSRGLLIYIAAVSYGVAVGLASGNWSSAIATDLRTSLGLVTGLCLAAMVPRRPRSLVAAVVVTSASAIVISTWVLLHSHGVAAISSLGRATTPGFFNINGLSYCLLAPSLILSSVAGGKMLRAISWLSGGFALLVAVVLTETRSLAGTVALSLFLGVAGAVALLAPSRSSGTARKALGKTVGMVVLLCVLVGVVGARYEDRVSAFLSRVRMKGGVTTDINYIERKDEAIAPFRQMDLFDHLTGMGFGAKSPRLGLDGEGVFDLHVGVLNVWWRLGVLWFVGLMAGLLLLIWKYGQAFSRARRRSGRPNQLRKATAIVACAPGVLALAATSLISGGWAVSATISLGIVWGIYRALVSPT